MKYDFITVRDRLALSAAKWTGMYEHKQDIPAGVIPFSVADMEFVNAPEIIKALQDWLAGGVLGYTKPDARYYDAVCGWMEQKHGYSVLPEQVVVCPGVVPALCYSVCIFTEKADGVIVMPPVYGPFYGAVEKNGRTCVKCPLIEQGLSYSIDFELLETLCAKPENKLLLFCNPHNPVGRVWSREELQRVADICTAHDVFIVSDEIHCDLTMPGYSHCSMSLIPGIDGHLIVCTAPSKTFNLASMQTANIIIKDPENRKRFRVFMDSSHTEMLNALGFAACTAAYEQCGDWMDEMLAVVYTNYCLVNSFIKKRLPRVNMAEMMATYLVWMDLRAYGLSQKELDQKLFAQNLFFSGGTAFGPEGEGFLRMNIACPTIYVEQALERLCAALAE